MLNWFTNSETGLNIAEGPIAWTVYTNMSLPNGTVPSSKGPFHYAAHEVEHVELSGSHIRRGARI